MEKQTKDLLIIMPAYSEEDCIGDFLERLRGPGKDGERPDIVLGPQFLEGESPSPSPC